MCNSLSSQTQKNVGSSWRNREAFVGVIVRKLHELLLLDA